MIAEVLQPENAFSKAVFNEIRPAIPRGQWPSEALYATFSGAPDGLSLIAAFEGFPSQYNLVAAQMVRNAKVGLVLASPLAPFAVQVVRARRWRDTFLYALLPLLFSIPFMGGLGDGAMRVSMGLCALDALALLVTHGRVMAARAMMNQNRFVALVPVPGLRLRPAAEVPLPHPG